MSEFDIDAFCLKIGIANGLLEPYNYERYRTINSLLTESMYQKMRESGVLWKIALGRRHLDKLSGEVLESNKWIELMAKAKYSKL